jgi:protein-disulfide isomerase
MRCSRVEEAMETTVNRYVIGGSAAAVLLIAFLLLRGNSNEGQQSDSESSSSSARTQAAQAAPAADVRFKVPVSSMQPSRGPKDALVTIVEWCDLRGSVCREADATLKELMAQYDGQLRRVFRAVPDSSRPDEAKRIHQFARAVYENGKDSDKFWKVSDQLLALPDSTTIGDAELRPIAKSVGADYDAITKEIEGGKLATAVALDTGFAARFGVSELPAIYVNGRPAVNGDSASELKRSLKTLIEQELANAEKVLAQGIERDKLYDKIVETGLWSLDDSPEKRQAAALKKPFIPTFSGEPARKP